MAEVIDFLNVKPGKRYIDATVDCGGHTIEILKRGGLVLGLDRDEEAIENLKKRVKGQRSALSEVEGPKVKSLDQRLTLVQGNFSKIGEIAKKYNFEDVDGILFDLGVSSRQLDNSSRGFSFLRSGPLDMRMDRDSNITAADLVNNFDKRRLYEIFKNYGQEKLSRPIADAIESARSLKPIETTGELTRIAETAYRKFGLKSKIHPATKIFLALRIVVNSELLNLNEALPQTVEILKVGGRLAVISFHSLEDAQVKRFVKRENRLKVLTQKPIGPTDLEIIKNVRSRSAKLRVAEKINA